MRPFVYPQLPAPPPRLADAAVSVGRFTVFALVSLVLWGAVYFGTIGLLRLIP